MNDHIEQFYRVSYGSEHKEENISRILKFVVLIQWVWHVLLNGYDPVNHTLSKKLYFFN